MREHECIIMSRYEHGAGKVDIAEELAQEYKIEVETAEIIVGVTLMRNFGVVPERKGCICLNI
jgi:hypothetical protein